MPEYEFDPIFEQRLERQLHDFANVAVRTFDAVEITRVAVTTGGRGSRSRLLVPPIGWRPVLILALLAIGLIGVGIIGGFIRLPDNNLVPNPSFEPFSPPPTILPTPGGPTASPNGSTVPSVMPASVPPSDGPATSSPPPTAPPSPEPSAEPTVLPTLTPEPSPPASPTLAPVAAVTAVAAGDSHSCALASDGRVFCWGFNDMGQLGDGTHDYRDFPTLPVVGIDDAVAISAGIRFSCAVRVDGSVWCWGEDPGSDDFSAVPFQVPVIDDATSVSAGGAFACALRSGGQVACWGLGSIGQLGNGVFENNSGVATPQAVVGLDDATQISAGWNHACAVRSDRSLWCWGGNGDGATGYGQLGDGTFENRSTPVRVTGLDNVAEVQAGGWTTCATLRDGSAWCWGYGERGTLGDGSFANSAVPLQVPGIDDARLLALGDYTACISRADNSVWCWGDTSWQGSNEEPPGTPRQGNKTRPATVVALANDRYCLLIDTRGQVWWWGTGTNQTPERWPVGP